MMKAKLFPAPLNPKNEYDQTIIDTCPGYAATFEQLGNEDAAAACRVSPRKQLYMSFTLEQRKRAARALYALSDVLDDSEDQYYLSRLADRILGYTAEDEGADELGDDGEDS